MAADRTATGSRDASMTVATPSDREIVVTRIFNAPRRLVFEAWTNPEHLPHWFTGPAGWPMTICEIDLRPGGASRFVWSGSDGAEVEIRGTYKEVAPPERVVGTLSWGGAEMLERTLIFTEKDGKTTASVTILYPSKEARDAAIQTGMVEGMAMGFDRLDQYYTQTLG